MPTVSIIVPTYNHARYLPRRIDSILKQSYTDYEIIFLDDASTDESVEIIRPYCHSPRCRLLINDQNSGSPFAQWNTGVASARGDLIWIAESDDAAAPQFLERLITVLREHPQVGLAYCQSKYINEQNDIIGTPFDAHARLNPKLWTADFLMAGREMLASYMAIKNLLPNASAVVFRKSLYDTVGGADADLTIAGDWLLWSKMLLKADIGFVAEPLNAFRVHHQTVRSTLSRQQQMLEAVQVQQFIYQHVRVNFTTSTQAVLELSKYFFQRPVRPQPGEFSRQGLFRLLHTVARTHDSINAALFRGLGILSLGILTCCPSVIRVLQKAYQLMSHLRLHKRNTDSASEKKSENP